MQISLSEPIWKRLYGPYGIQDVAGVLRKLEGSWDVDLAEDLFWEKLHHQDDLYPVTYAALPWLWETYPQASKSTSDALVFFSHVLDCAIRPGGTGCDGEGPRGHYRGLSLLAADHAHTWIAENDHLQDTDMDVLRSLERWFSTTAPTIANRCIQAVSAKDRYEAAMLSTGFATLHRGYNTAIAMIWWADEHDMATILEHWRPSSQDVQAAATVRRMISDRNSELGKFLEAYSTGDL